MRPEMPSSVLEPEHRSMMCAPLMGPSQMPLGIIYIDTEDSLHPFGADDLDVLVCIAILAGQAMEQASVSEARYRAVVDAAADGILTINDKGVIQSVNPAIERLFGYAAHELIGQPVAWLSAHRENGAGPVAYWDSLNPTRTIPPWATCGKPRAGEKTAARFRCRCPWRNWNSAANGC